MVNNFPRKSVPSVLLASCNIFGVIAPTPAARFAGRERIREMKILICTGKTIRKLWRDETAQDIAEYAVMLAVILVIVVGTIQLIGSNANNVFSNVASSLQ
jgi:Flp pilus assembly pilin Flp